MTWLSLPIQTMLESPETHSIYKSPGKGKSLKPSVTVWQQLWEGCNAEGNGANK